MSKWLISGSILGVILVTVLMFVGYIFSILNTDARLRTTKNAKQLDNTSEFDNMKKKIYQIVQIPEQQFAKLKDIFVSQAQARTGEGTDQNLIMNSVPDVNLFSFLSMNKLFV